MKAIMTPTQAKFVEFAQDCRAWRQAPFVKCANWTSQLQSPDKAALSGEFDRIELGSEMGVFECHSHVGLAYLGCALE